MRSRFRAGVFVLIAAGVVTAVHAQQDITFFVAAKTQSGETVTDLKAEEVIFTEGDRRGSVVKVVPVTWPVKVTVLVDNGVGTGPMLSLYRSGALKLDELVTRTYTLNDVNEGYQDMFDGVNIRGVIHHTG